MQQRRRSKLGTLSMVVFGLTLSFLDPQVTNAAKFISTCYSLVTGSYLTTIANADGDFVGRSILTLSGDRTASSIDSSQGGLEGSFNPFSSAHGSWQCTGKQTFVATNLNFTFAGSVAPDLGIARVDFKAMVDRETQVVEGTIELRFFPLRGNPMVDKTTPWGTFTFVGQRIIP